MNYSGAVTSYSTSHKERNGSIRTLTNNDDGTSKNLHNHERASLQEIIREDAYLMILQLKIKKHLNLCGLEA